MHTTILRTWIELDKNALIHNLTTLKKQVGLAHIAPVIKCNAYGHGLTEIAQLCDTLESVTMVCVSYASEALYLRTIGIKKPILVLSYCDLSLDTLVGMNVALVIDTLDQLTELAQIGVQAGIRMPVHIKIDTGLTRRGISCADAYSFIKRAHSYPFIRVEGVCSHFSHAYKIDAPITRLQIERFEQVIKILEQDALLPPYVHMSNSSLIPIYRATLYRPGIAVYGYSPIPTSYPLKPVLRFKTRIAQLRSVPMGVAIGYNERYHTAMHTRIAVLPVGYADGYDRRLSNNGQVLVNNCLAPVRGMIGMNLMTIDVGQVPNSAIGDEVHMIGDQEGINAMQLISYANMDNVRELFARLNPTIPRIII
jgi:alanine racemase